MRGGRRLFFVAALRASEGQIWLKEVVKGDPVRPRYRTQARWIEWSGRLLGLGSDGSEPVAEKVARQLEVPAEEHRQARRDYQQAGTLCGRGRALWRVVRLLRVDQQLWFRLLSAGCLTGVWKRAILWERGVSPRALYSSPSAPIPRAPP
jgi:hypothetical protein